MSFMRSWQTTKTPLSPARQRRVDELMPHLIARHCTFKELVSTQGEWRVEVELRPEAIDWNDGGYDYWNDTRRKAQRATWPELVAVFADDLAYARHIHELRGRRLQGRMLEAKREYERATNVYGTMQRHVLMAHLEGRETEMPDRQQRVLDAEEAATTNHNILLAAQRAFADYTVSCPATQEGAAAYLAGCPLMKDRKKESA